MQAHKVRKPNLAGKSPQQAKAAIAQYQFRVAQAKAGAARVPFYKSPSGRPPATFVSGKGELKAIDLPEAAYQFSAATGTNANVTLLNVVQEGTSFYQRVGRKIEMKSLHIKGYIIPQAIANTAPDFIQWAVVYDRQPSLAAALPIYSSIFQDVSAAGAAVSSVWASVNLDDRDRYVVLRNKRIWMPTNTAVAGTNPSQNLIQTGEQLMINEFIKLGNLTSQYGPTANPITIANIATGALYFVTQGTVAAGSNGFAAALTFRLKYHDQ